MWRTYSKKYILLLTGLMLLTGTCMAAGGGGGQVKAIAILDGSQHQIKVDSFRTVVDSAFFNPSYISTLDTSYTVQNQVTLMINEASGLYFRDSAFSVTVQMQISYVAGSGASDTASVIRSFTVKYDSAGSYNSRSTFAFTGGRQVTVKILSITSTVTNWDPTTVLLIENQLTTTPIFKFACSGTVTNITVSPSADPTADELPVSWTTVLGADQYDLEWTYIDTSALRDTNAAGQYKYGNPLNPDLVFRNNATRVSITGTSYNIPLIYDDSGTLFIRVRPVQLGNGYAVTNAIWSSDASPSVLGAYRYTGHERPLNWQSNISFAEEGKRKVVLQYYDGSLRSRQTVTKDNTTNTTIVGETYYDYQGRPAIQVMPAPTLNTIIKYTASFNVSINGAPYSQSNYDTLPYPGAFCSIHADPMIDTSGASLYYSTHNPADTAGLNQFIPNAQNYPFTQTDYTPDNTGRISRQGGVGPLYQLGLGHETKYYYGTPDQNELDGLFGTEVGDRSHYFKNMVRDANGQYSISYVDMHGRTIATALAGITPASMTALPSNQTSKITETLADSNSNAVSPIDQSMVSQKSLVVPMADTFQFKYNLTPAIFSELNCTSQTICYTCKYDLEISITDNCNNQLLGGQPFDTVVHNFSVDSTNTCTPTNRGLNFSLILPEGAYVVTKKLTPNRDAYNYYLDSVYLKNNTCVSMAQFITQQKAIATSYNPTCAPSCSACLDSVGTWPAFWANYIARGGLTPADTAAYSAEAQTAYQNAISACSTLCQNNLADDNDILNAMLQDVSPPFGQYADTSMSTPNKDYTYSIFYIPPADSSSYVPVFKLPAVRYLDDNGNPDSVYSETSGIMVPPNALSETQFVQSFRSSWANALLPYHPEYCKLLALQSQHNSGVWDRQMESVDDYQDALNEGFLNPTGNGTLSPYTVVPGNIDPLSTWNSSELKSLLEAQLRVYKHIPSPNVVLNMWQMACAMAKCDSGSSACLIQYSTLNDPFGSLSCAGDQDMAWRYFREIYQGVKQQILNQYVISVASCVPANNRVYHSDPTTAQLYAKNYQPEFGDVTSGLKRSNLQQFQNVSGSTAAENLQAVAADSAASFYLQTSAAYVAQWAQQLAPCISYGADLNNLILPALDTICRRACDSAHPYGASSLPPGMTYTPSWATSPCQSFQDVINQYNQLHHITDTLDCNAEVITSPLPYGNQAVYSNKPVYTRPSDCECSLITNLYNQYTASTFGDASFAAFLLRTQQITMSSPDLSTLLSMCGNTTNSATCKFLPTPIYLPPAMQCYSGQACSTCQTIDSLYSVYRSQYPTDTPSIASDRDTAQAQKNTLFQNFMNNRLGYNMQTWQYLQFMDTCQAHSADTARTSTCLPTTIAMLFNSGGTDHMTDMRTTPDGGYVMVGNTKPAGATDSSAYILRYNSAGNIQWAKTYSSASSSIFSKVRVTSDGGYVAVGAAYSNASIDSSGNLLVVKTDPAGNTLWEKSISFPASQGEAGFDIIQTHDGGYAVVGDHNLTQGHRGPALFLVVKMDSTGNVTWARAMGNTIGNDGYSIVESGDTLLMAGRQGVATYGNDGVLLKINESTGTILSSFDVQDNVGGDMGFQMANMYPTPTGYQFYTYVSEYGEGIDSGMVGALNLGFDGTVLQYNRINLPPGNFAADALTSAAMIPTLDGGWITGETAPASNNIYWIKINSNGTTGWTRMSKLPGMQTIGNIVQNADSSFTVLGADGGVAMMLNLSSSGAAGCYDSLVSVGVTNPPLYSFAVTQPIDSVLTPVYSGALLTENLVTINSSTITCPGSGNCYMMYNGPLLCGKSSPIFPPIGVDSTTTCTDSTYFGVSNGTEIFNAYSDSLTGDFEQRYNALCMQAYKYESFTVTHTQQEYHYTLYYYDQAGNLVKTVPPAGVQQITDTNQLKLVRAARAAGQVLVPTHTLVTNYRYNTLNQVMSQLSPDGRESNFWYDRLGRLALSQNRRQQLTNLYSYTQYDSIGRIVQVGQLTSATAITDTISRVDAALLLWESNAASTANQITVTSYDSAYSAMSLELSPVNLRNRVAWTGLFNTAADLAKGNPNAAAATYYSYDILGNVDTLVQDYGSGDATHYADISNPMNANGSRYKKVVYDFDLVSGKVNQVSYQHGNADAFYHSYLYDAENRITNVQSSTDSINWDNDAFYSYYAHGPLARTVLGQQQVQGINYAYTLQGWLKAINPAPYTGANFTLRPDSASNVVAGTAYNLLLNYYNGDYSPISGVAGPDSAVSTTLGVDSLPLYNGNISSMGVNVRKIPNPLLYNYQYDQLNRLIHMNAWNRTRTAWSAITQVPDFQESIAYDPNGNIQKYKRNGNNTFAGQPIGMDSLNYFYTAGTNKLDHITDSVPSSNYTTDIDGQSSGNYQYDSIGELISDAASGISNITWTVNGKIASITKSGDTTINFTYDAGGNRISKTVVAPGNTITTWYVRDAQGNVLSVYTYGDPSVSGGDLAQTELHIYGSSRLGIWKTNNNVELTPPVLTSAMPLLGTGDSLIFTRGNKLFELTNHLGNVLATISDKRYGVSTNDSTVNYYVPEIVSANDYYPFGSLEPGRSYTESNVGSYRYGFNGKEKDDEVKGAGDQIDYGMRVYDPRIGKFLSVDPFAKKFAYYSPYQFAGNTPIQAIDLDGQEEYHYTITLDKQWKTHITNAAPPRYYNEDIFGNKYKISERYIVDFDGDRYNIGFAGAKGTGNQNAVWIFDSWKEKPDARLLPYLFYTETESYNGGVKKSIENARNYLVALLSTGYVHDPTTNKDRMLGEKGPQIASKKIKQWGKTERIDVENPDPGNRPGQIQYHDPNNEKYLYNVNTDKFYSQSEPGIWDQEAPKSVNKLLEDKSFRKEIDKGLKYLGEQSSTPGGVAVTSTNKTQ